MNRNSDIDVTVYRGQLTHDLGNALHAGAHGLDVIPRLLRLALEQEAWKERVVIETGEVIQGFTTFEEYVRATPPAGLGADMGLIKRIIGNDATSRDLLDKALQRVDGRPTETFNNVQSLQSAPQGNSADAGLRRLRKDRPDLHERVLAGELTTHAAMKIAGFRRETITLPITDTMYEAARIVVKRLDALQYDRFFQHLVYLASHEDDEDYGVVDANPTDNTNK